MYIVNIYRCIIFYIILYLYYIMLSYILFYYVILYYIMLYYFILFYIILCYTILYYIMHFDIVRLFRNNEYLIYDIDPPPYVLILIVQHMVGIYCVNIAPPNYVCLETMLHANIGTIFQQ